MSSQQAFHSEPAGTMRGPAGRPLRPHEVRTLGQGAFGSTPAYEEALRASQMHHRVPEVSPADVAAIDAALTRPPTQVVTAPPGPAPMPMPRAAAPLPPGGGAAEQPRPPVPAGPHWSYGQPFPDNWQPHSRPPGPAPMPMPAVSAPPGPAPMPMPAPPAPTTISPTGQTGADLVDALDPQLDYLVGQIGDLATGLNPEDVATAWRRNNMDGFVNAFVRSRGPEAGEKLLDTLFRRHFHNRPEMAPIWDAMVSEIEKGLQLPGGVGLDTGGRQYLDPLQGPGAPEPPRFSPDPTTFSGFRRQE